MGGKNGDDVTLKMLQRWEGRGEFPKKEIKWKKEEKKKKRKEKNFEKSRDIRRRMMACILRGASRDFNFFAALLMTSFPVFLCTLLFPKLVT